ncbi:adhesion regulating molecule family protein [Heterostelium album PN500]|uniref:Adhesion regulating molecule family protein n=1 Tax=Heterostelium pallidum (strain ATCC 26659 / Pp 5 / PN500) TaxID=670386 RepID=D3B5X9_HETP5|nr:adhesion regulating molecule family protein [Heterostelium album PN500]EFA83277.1 adhesion regulating molecule family protein [Heterostelium album PN500]|eukprot:XP_020435394.1 adhesion regulating molecule family protein [Heterostelium album PN500]
MSLRRAKPQNVEFKAGKAKLEGKTITSDTRKGTLKFSIQDDLIFVQWFVRDSKEAEDEYYLAPGELIFKKVSSCKDGRMYYLHFSTSDNKEFFWLQEPNPDNDTKLEEAIAAIAAYQPDDDESMSTEPTTTTTSATPAPAATTTNTTPASSAPAPTTTSTAPTSSSSSSSTSGFDPNNFSQLANYIANFQPTAKSRLTLSHVLTPENLTPIVSDETVQKELLEYLPENNRNTSDIMQLLYTPQFQQAIDQLNYAIYDGHGNDIIAQMGLEPSMIMNIENFLNCIQEGTNKKKKRQEQQQQK